MVDKVYRGACDEKTVPVCHPSAQWAPSGLCQPAFSLGRDHLADCRVLTRMALLGVQSQRRRTPGTDFAASLLCQRHLAHAAVRRPMPILQLLCSTCTKCAGHSFKPIGLVSTTLSPADRARHNCAETDHCAGGWIDVDTLFSVGLLASNPAQEKVDALEQATHARGSFLGIRPRLPRCSEH